MTIDPALLLSVVSIVIAAVVGLSGLKRNRTHDDKQEATELTTVIVRLENISNGINEIKSDMKNMREDIKELRERVIVVEQQSQSAHKRLDAIEKAKGVDTHENE